MLTADLAGARRRGRELTLPRLDDELVARVRELAAGVLAEYRGAVGEPRAELAARLAALEVPARERVIFLGLKKLLDDRASFGAEVAADPVELRAAAARVSARVRAAAATPEAFDRDAVLAEVGAAFGLSAAEVEGALYADLKEAQILESLDVTGPDELVERWALGRVQAVLLKATRVRAWLRPDGADALRALFARLRFFQLLFELHEEAGPDDDDRSVWRLELDGPFALFAQSTRYGVKLALALPTLLTAGLFRLEADVTWGKARQELLFAWDGSGLLAPPPPAGPPPVRDEVRALSEAFADDDRWVPHPATTVLHLPGAGLCVPDLTFEDKQTGALVHVEILGFWSRDAVWRRVELARAGLEAPVLFLASSRLRVSEAVLDDHESAALYVFKGTPRKGAVADHLAELVTPRRRPPRGRSHTKGTPKKGGKHRTRAAKSAGPTPGVRSKPH